MLLYCGSTLEVKDPEINEHEVGRDFGIGFYTTESQDQAERWAIKRSKIESRYRKQHVYAVVNVYEWNNSNELSLKYFEDVSMEWLDLVLKCRGDTSYSHGYDVVVGKIADDDVGETVSYVMNGIMRKEDGLKRLELEKINNQIVFCSKRSLKELTFVRSYLVEAN